MTVDPDPDGRFDAPTSWPAAVVDAIRGAEGTFQDRFQDEVQDKFQDEVQDVGAKIVAAGDGRWTTAALRIAMIDAVRAPHADALVTAAVDSAGSAGLVVAGGDLLLAADGWIVATRPAGHAADRPDLHADPDDLVVAVAAGLRALHDLGLPPETDAAGWEALAERCRQTVAGGMVDRAALPPPYDRYSDETLLAMVVDGRPSTEAPCICHGRPELGEFIVEGGRFTGFANLDRLVVADPHLDLAVIHQSLHHLLGPEAVFRFYEAYGADPDIVRLDHYILISHLLGLSPAVAADGQPS